MAKIIIDEKCIQCGVCIPVCPNDGIAETDDGMFHIDPNLCTECAGMFSVSQCVDVCPVDAVETDPDRVEAEEILLSRAADIHPGMFPRD